MSLQIEAYRAEHSPAVHAFNERLARGGIEFRFPEQAVSRDFPPHDGAALKQEFYLAVDGEYVRGGYILKSESFFGPRGESLLGNYQLPLSEGIVDRTQAMVGVKLLWDAIARQPSLYCLGMGGLERPLPKMLARLGWSVEAVPFFFRVVRASRFLAEIRFLRQGPGRAPLLDLARFSGLGALGRGGWDAWTAVRRPALSSLVKMRRVRSFGPDVDALVLDLGKSREAFCDRRASALALKFPESDARFVRIVVEEDGQLKGWALLTRSTLQDHKQFGNLRLGCVADNFARPGYEAHVLRFAYATLLEEGVDLVVTNQSHQRWTEALKGEGFLRGPSNFALARSPRFTELSGPLDHVHFTRGDGDGPIHL